MRSKEEEIRSKFRRAIKECSICKIAIADSIDSIELKEPTEETKWIYSCYSYKFNDSIRHKKLKKSKDSLLEVLENGSIDLKGPMIIRIKNDAFRTIATPILKDNGTFIFYLEGRDRTIAIL